LKRAGFSVTAMLAWALMGMGEPPRPPMSVCDFAENVGKLDGRIVKVRGVVQTFSPDPDDFYLDEMIADSCTGSKQKSVRVEIWWPDSHFLEHPPRGYKVDRASFRRFARIVKKAQAQGKSVERLLATVEGVAYASGPESQSADPARRQYHGIYQGYIVIQAVRDVKIL